MANQILADIAEGKYADGDRLPSERKLAQMFEVSRPVVREAIVALEICKAVEVKPNSGIYALSWENRKEPPSVNVSAGAFELFEARLVIEGETAFMAASTLSDATIGELGKLTEEMQAAEDKNWIDRAEVIDERFHLIIAEGTNNGVLNDIVVDLWEARRQSPLAMRLLAQIHGRGISRRVDEHAHILSALKERDPHAARAAMRRHIGCVIAELAAATELDMQSNPSPGDGQDGSSSRSGANHHAAIRTLARF